MIITLNYDYSHDYNRMMTLEIGSVDWYPSNQSTV